REALGAGTIFGLKVSESYQPASVMIMAPGAFIVLGLLLGFFNWWKLRKSETSMKAHMKHD
ncbi:MAG: electron transport complex subunit RsxE, partial [Candidatus Brocadia sp.]